MATHNLDVSTSPRSVATAIGFALAVSRGTVDRIEIQNVSTTATLFVREQVMPPTAGHRGRRVESGGVYETLLHGSAAIWVWTDDPGGCACVVRIL